MRPITDMAMTGQNRNTILHVFEYLRYCRNIYICPHIRFKQIKFLFKSFTIIYCFMNCWYMILEWKYRSFVFTEDSFCLRVLSLPAYVCPSVRVCVNRDNLSSVQARKTKFEPYVQNTLVLRSLFGLIDLDFQSQI